MTCWLSYMCASTFKLYVNVFFKLILELFEFSWSLLLSLYSAFGHYWYLFEMVSFSLTVYLNDLTIVPVNEFLSTDGLDKLGLRWSVSIWVQLNTFKELLFFLHLLFLLYFYHSQLFNQWGVNIFIKCTFYSKKPFLGCRSS